MVEGMGQCSHGPFVLRDGCPKCIAEERAVNSPEGIGARIEEARGTPVPLMEQEVPLKVKPQLVKVRYYSITTGEISPREYTYYSVDRLAVGEVVSVPVRGHELKARVSVINVPESEIADFKDKVKTIPSGSGAPDPAEVGVHIKIASPSDVEEPPESVQPETENHHLRPEEGDGVVALTREEHLEEHGATMEVFVSGKTFSPEELEASTAVIKVDPGTTPSFARHLEAAKRVLEIAVSREIITEADAKAVNDDLNVMAGLEKAVDEERKTFTVPLNGYLGSINGSYRLITGPLGEAKKIYRRLLTDWKVAQNKKAAEAEKINRDAQDLARRQAEANQGVFTVETKPVPVPFVPRLTRTDQGTSGLIDVWKYRIVDLDKLPREYMVPDDAMLTSIAKNHHDKKQVAGVEFYNDPSLRTSRR